MSTNSFDLTEIFEILQRITFANLERVALTKIYQNLKNVKQNTWFLI